MKRQSVALTIFLISPVLIVILLLWLIERSLVTGPAVHLPAIGAGANRTGMANQVPQPPQIAPGTPAQQAERLAPTSAAPQPAVNLVAPESLDGGFILLVRDLSGLSSADSPIYLASNHNGWNPGDPAMQLAPRSDGRWQIILPKPTDPSPLEFKFTRGSWERTETSADLTDIANRTLPKVDPGALAPGERPVIEFEIPKFSDQRPGSARERWTDDPTRPLRVTGDVRRLQVVGGGGGARGSARDLLVWLPPGYDAPANAERRYPVLYMMDGQNLFEAPPGVPGEWQIDETATRLIGEGTVEPLIIVGIPHAGPYRAGEYAPVEILPGVEPDALGYIRFLLTEVMPRVERAFRVETGPERTGIGGSSLGGLISLLAATDNPHVFGKVLAESPSIVLGDGPVWRDIADATTTWPGRIYLGMGGREAGTAPENADLNALYTRAAKDFQNYLMAPAGRAKPPSTTLVLTETAVHNEPAWAARFPGALEFLFPAK